MKTHPTPALFAGVALQKAGAKLACFLLLCGALASCASQPRNTVAQAQPPPLYDWHGDGVSGPTTVNVVLNEQKAYIYRGGQPAGWTYLASGKSGHATPTGTFSVLEKRSEKSSGTYGAIVDSSGRVIDSDATAGREPIPRGSHFVGARMPYWMRLTGGGIGMHAGIIPQPGLPASHGCIRLPAAMTAKLYDVVDVGSKVVVTYDAPASSPQLTASAE
ncbi:MAG TPA: L,D-transpeptidase family protein [Candidatus Saccharimonadia bacterium]|nr:L,D-transpeptidase family protein [Candidatus Saccharimonadia bacterium]